MIDKIVQMKRFVCLRYIAHRNTGKNLNVNSRSLSDLQLYFFLNTSNCLINCLHSCIVPLSDVHVHHKRFQKVAWPFHRPQGQMRLKLLVVVPLL